MINSACKTSQKLQKCWKNAGFESATSLLAVQSSIRPLTHIFPTACPLTSSERVSWGPYGHKHCNHGASFAMFYIVYHMTSQVIMLTDFQGTWDQSDFQLVSYPLVSWLSLDVGSNDTEILRFHGRKVHRTTPKYHECKKCWHALKLYHECKKCWHALKLHDPCWFACNLCLDVIHLWISS